MSDTAEGKQREAFLTGNQSLSQEPIGKSDEIPVLLDVVVLGNATLRDTIVEDDAERTRPSNPIGVGAQNEEIELFKNRLISEYEFILRESVERATTEVKSQVFDQVEHFVTQILQNHGIHLNNNNQAIISSKSETPQLTMHVPSDTPVTIATDHPLNDAPVSREEAVTHSQASLPNVSMDKTYDPDDIEQRWYETWESKGYFSPGGSGPAYCIMLPPPNVTGSLHMGHAFQDTLMDCLIRYHRMRGHNTLWQCGTDHAGIATQMVVERQLAEKGIKRIDIGREAFVNEVWRWKEHSGGTITRQLRRLGTSMDWSRERFTLDSGLSKAVTEVFVRLYEEGLIYRGKRLVNWDPVLHTAISDLEVISSEENGSLWHLRYPLENGEGHLVVATTRPETMLGDAAVAVHPEDPRYQHLIGQNVLLPLTGRVIPIIGDNYVDPTFGSGCVKITPAHDFNDYEVGRRHDLPQINIFTPDAVLNDTVPIDYQGLDRYVARKRIIADLEAQGLLERIQDHKLMVPRGDRSNAVIEPYLTDQWYVKIKPLAEPAIAAVQDGRIRFVPENWSKTYYEWMNNIEDWCISRQLWWGHRIPAWYDWDGNIYVGRSEAEIREKHALGEERVLIQDDDVLDTWFSSALWPFSTLGWPDKSPDLKAFYPTNVLVTGFDIIFFWVARMIMMGLKFTGDVPFREVYIHGLVRDSEGQKMSKSKGNILDPIDLIDGIDLESLVIKRTTGLMQPEAAPKIEKSTRKQFAEGIPGYGADALRMTFAALATQGRDVRFELGRIEGYRNYCNKLWNAARFVSLSIQNIPAAQEQDKMVLGLAERWIVARLQETEKAVIEAFNTYRFDLAVQAIYEFTWEEYCDWYLELSKATLNNPRSTLEIKLGTRQVLVGVLEVLLRLVHPIIPFISEEIWQRVAPLAGMEADSIMLHPYPVPDDTLIDEAVITEFNWVKNFIVSVRRIRAENNIPPSKGLAVYISQGTTQENQWLRENILYMANLAKIDSLRVLKAEITPDMASGLVGEMLIAIPLAGVIDRDAEMNRLTVEVSKLYKEKERVTGKLDNADFIQRAPEDVVAKERARQAEIITAIAQLEEQLTRVSSWTQ